jgi:hypothetical protein
MTYQLKVLCEGFIEVEVVADSKEEAMKKVFESHFAIWNEEFKEISGGDLSVDIVYCVESDFSE